MTTAIRDQKAVNSANSANSTNSTDATNVAVNTTHTPQEQDAFRQVVVRHTQNCKISANTLEYILGKIAKSEDPAVVAILPKAVDLVATMRADTSTFDTQCRNYMKAWGTNGPGNNHGA